MSAPLVAIDLETTGLGHTLDPPRQDWILEIGVANYLPIRLPYYGVWSTLVALPPDARGDFSEALAINGRRAEHLRAGEEADAAIRRAIWKIEDAWSYLTPGSPRALVAFRASFDRGFLEQHKRWRDWQEATGVVWVCAMELAAARFKRDNGRISLRNACAEAHLAVDPNATHRAAYDARLALQVARYCARDWRASP